jgi:hypothetical protein
VIHRETGSEREIHIEASRDSGRNEKGEPANEQRGILILVFFSVAFLSIPSFHLFRWFACFFASFALRSLSSSLSIRFRFPLPLLPVSLSPLSARAWGASLLSLSFFYVGIQTHDTYTHSLFHIQPRPQRRKENKPITEDTGRDTALRTTRGSHAPLSSILLVLVPPHPNIEACQPANPTSRHGNRERDQTRAH